MRVLFGRVVEGHFHLLDIFSLIRGPVAPIFSFLVRSLALRWQQWCNIFIIAGTTLATLAFTVAREITGLCSGMVPAAQCRQQVSLVFSLLSLHRKHGRLAQLVSVLHWSDLQPDLHGNGGWGAHPFLCLGHEGVAEPSVIVVDDSRITFFEMNDSRTDEEQNRRHRHLSA